MKKTFALLFACVILILTLSGCGVKTPAADSTDKNSISDFSDAKIGSVSGSVQAEMLKKLLPDAKHSKFNSLSDGIMALTLGKVDAFSTENSVLCSLQWEGMSFKRVEEPIAVSNYGFIFTKDKKTELQNEVNAFLSSCEKDGTLGKLKSKWFASSEPTEFADYETLNGTKGVIKVAIGAQQKPFAYMKNGKYAGFDIDLLTAFAKEYGYSLVIEDSSFDGIISGVQSGIYDIGASGITITEERKGTLDFSDCYYSDDLVLIVNKTASATRTLDEFRNAKLGVIVGSIYDGYSRELFPEAKIDAYQSFPDLFQCIKQGKVDGFLLDMPNFNAAKRTDKNLTYITVPGYNVEIGYAFGKNENGDSLKAQMDTFLNELRADGSLDKLWDKWCGEVEPSENIKVPDLSGNTKELRVAFDSSRKPFVYKLNNEYAGFEVEVLYMFCQKYGYNPKIEDAQWTAGVAGLQQNKYDVVSCGIYITEERKESVNFCEPYMIADIVMVTYEKGAEEQSFFASIKESFDKTFIREARWKLIVEGIAVTLIISFFSVLGGTLFGFIFYLITRSKFKAVSKVAKAIAKIYSVIISGTPTLVVLMILFYIIFGKTEISGIAVAIIGFGLTFGSFVCNNLDITVENVDKGQTEAAYALGYTRNKTFFRIVLPQALKMFIPAYTGEIVGLIKATSIVGYIAVNDLTRMGDIIRSNTYEAFFPLIAVAVIYFIITRGIAAILGVFAKKLDPRKRKAKNILKGVVK